MLRMTLKELRISRNLTKPQLSRFAGVTQGTIAQLESGKIIHPSWEAVYRLSYALCTIPELLFPIEGFPILPERKLMKRRGRRKKND